jgi:hypothetical protein
VELVPGTETRTKSDMPLPERVTQILSEIGQVAAEVTCYYDEYREFIAVYATPKARLPNVDRSLSYYANAKTIYRAIRFRVRSEIIEADLNVGPNDLAGLQQIYLPSEEAVEYVLSLWQISPDELLSPREVAIPV